jgi:E3 ubiquitin-protein ligase makorin
VPTHFVVPAPAWPESPEEKEEVVAAYKARLAATDCAHFSRGAGRCPFGGSCFYRHAYADGTLERLDLPADLRRAGDADGGVRVLAPVTLSAFFETPAARRAMRGGPGGGGGGGRGGRRQR